jgi:hypothetical protein
MTAAEIQNAIQNCQSVYILEPCVSGQNAGIRIDYGRIVEVFNHFSGEPGRIVVKMDTRAGKGRIVDASILYQSPSAVSAILSGEFAPSPVPKPVPSWPDAESRVRKAIKDLEDAPVSFDGDNPCVDKYRAILDAELRLLELRVKVELAEIGQADRDRIMSKLTPVVTEEPAK